jgi:hypothetical protein
MQQSEEFEPVFLAAQLCRTSGNSAQCIEAIQNVARNMADAKGSRENDIGNKVRFGYDLDAIDSSFKSGKSIDLDYNLEDEYVPPKHAPTLKGKEEMPSYHINKSKYFISGASLISSNQLKPSTIDVEDNVKTIALPPPQNSQIAKANPMASVILPVIHKKETETVVCNSDSDFYILFIGFIIPFILIFSILWVNKCNSF